MNTPIDKRLIFAYFANTASPLQKRLIDEWLRQKAHQELFFAWLVEWEEKNPPYVPLIDAPLDRFRRHMIAHAGPVAPSGPLPLRIATGSGEVRIPARWLAAACFTLVLLSAGWLFRNELQYQTYQTGYGQTQTVGLPDGSTVVLNANSSVRVPRFGFATGSLREVWLRGEAYFSVKHLAENKPFLVRTQRSFEVLVHGTEFTVSTFDRRAQVMLRSGRVQVNYGGRHSRKQLMLRPGDLVSLNQPTRPVVQHRVSAQPYVAFTEHRFSFENMTLREFGYLLKDTYGLTVEIPDSTVAERTLVGSYSAQNADELLQIVSELFDLTVVRQADTLRLTQHD